MADGEGRDEQAGKLIVVACAVRAAPLSGSHIHRLSPSMAIAQQHSPQNDARAGRTLAAVGPGHFELGPAPRKVWATERTSQINNRKPPGAAHVRVDATPRCLSQLFHESLLLAFFCPHHARRMLGIRWRSPGRRAYSHHSLRDVGGYEGQVDPEPRRDVKANSSTPPVRGRAHLSYARLVVRCWQ